jgi:cytochrome oxidase Cu insertion factor (SCO1/SenC/PrrC family)
MKKNEFTVVRLPSPGAFLLACVLAFGFPSSAAQAQHAHPAGKKAAPQVGTPAMPFVLKTLDGKSISLVRYRGTPLMINFSLAGAIHAGRRCRLSMI